VLQLKRLLKWISETGLEGEKRLCSHVITLWRFLMQYVRKTKLTVVVAL
jgi:hypothetical protein